MFFGKSASRDSSDYDSMVSRQEQQRAQEPGRTGLHERDYSRQPAGVRATPRQNPAQGSQNTLVAEKLNRGHLAYDQGQLDQAKVHYEDVLKLQPKHGEAHHRLAVIADRQPNPDFKVAEQHYLTALQSKGSDPDLLSDLGYSYYLQGRLDESDRYLTQALSVNPLHVRALNNRGLLLGRRGDYNGALASFQKAGSDKEAQAKMAMLFPKGPPAADDQTRQLQQMMAQARQQGLAARQARAASTETNPFAARAESAGLAQESRTEMTADFNGQMGTPGEPAGVAPAGFNGRDQSGLQFEDEARGYPSPRDADAELQRLLAGIDQAETPQHIPDDATRQNRQPTSPTQSWADGADTTMARTPSQPSRERRNARTDDPLENMPLWPGTTVSHADAQFDDEHGAVEQVDFATQTQDAFADRRQHSTPAPATDMPYEIDRRQPSHAGYGDSTRAAIYAGMNAGPGQMFPVGYADAPNGAAQPLVTGNEFDPSRAFTSGQSVPPGTNSRLNGADYAAPGNYESTFPSTPATGFDGRTGDVPRGYGARPTADSQFGVGGNFSDDGSTMPAQPPESSSDRYTMFSPGGDVQQGQETRLPPNMTNPGGANPSRNAVRPQNTATQSGQTTAQRDNRSNLSQPAGSASVQSPMNSGTYNATPSAGTRGSVTSRPATPEEPAQWPMIQPSYRYSGTARQ